MNATSATCADEDGDDDDDGEAADMEGSISFSPDCRLAAMLPQLDVSVSFQSMRKAACWKQMR